MIRAKTQRRRTRRLRSETLESRLALAALYVSPAGSDSNPGTAAAPWSTLQKAANSVSPGDVVTVRAGNYVGFDLRRDGTSSARISFVADSGVAITARNAVTPDGINLEGADFITIDGFTVNSMPRAGIRSVTNQHVTIRDNRTDRNGTWGIFAGFSPDLLIENNVTSRSQSEHGIYVSNSGDRPTIRGNTSWGNNAAGIHMNGDISQGGDGVISNALVENNIIYDNGVAGGSGINADGVQNSRFRNNLLYNNHASGISLFQIDGGAPSSGNTVVNNTIDQAADGRWALNIQDAAINSVVRNNILYNKHSFRGSFDISSDSLPGLVSDYNVVMNRLTTDGGDTVLTLAQWRAATGRDQHSLVATPAQLFVDAAGGDYHLAVGSPAIDAGTSLTAPTYDLQNQPRPSGAAWDIGAYERQSTAVNRAPVLNNSLSPQLAAIKEDATNPAGTLVSSLLSGGVTDPDAGALRGIAVTAASGLHGKWQYTLNGGNTWTGLGAPASSAARLLAATARVRFLPSPNFNGQVTLYYRAWDQTQGASGGTLNVTGNTGGSASLSTATESATLKVQSVNDKPVVAVGGSVAYVRNQPAITLASAATVTDVDSANFDGGRLRVWITTGASTTNRLAIGAGFTVDANNNVRQGSTIIGKRSANGLGANDLIVTLNSNATKAVVQQLVRAISFRTVNGVAGSRTVLFTVSDGDGGLSTAVAKKVNTT